MFTNYGTYEVEKTIQFRQNELNKRLRIGRLLEQLTPEHSSNPVPIKQPRSLWQRWFTSRRLDTSTK
jgi:hypothetical protein